ncbi:hypothetical protein LO772_31950 [Yinghuangia sp. ASG 101]|uniref:hypothetical protein n=1 Tax=Yinghuangia sp. ASG 101 TaxID=2896848 RepID=UPI001E40DAF8|nr:hypothetical protein [Yinghuangia sp. ASG 101]UGQ11357.1 hypothetical protein LO772_31950 [Yinghuangia sp. ASG 101]
MIALGVSKGVEGVSALNLRALSGPTAYDGTNAGAADYYQTADFATAGRQLHDLAMAQCQGSISVVKQIVPSSTTGEDTTGAVNAGAGWTFDATTTTSGIGGMPTTETTTDDGTGSVAFQPSFNTVGTGAFTVSETQHADHELVTQNGRNAVCTDLGTGDPVEVANTGTADAPGFSLGVDASQAVSCVVYNRPVVAADVTVDKTWRINGKDYEQGAQPDDFDASLTLTGPGAAGATAQPWGTPRTGYRVGDHPTADETVRLADGCTLDSARVTSVDGETTDLPLPHTAEVNGPHLRMGITNTVTCPGSTTSPTPTPTHSHTAPPTTTPTTPPTSAHPTTGHPTGHPGTGHPTTTHPTHATQSTSGHPAPTHSTEPGSPWAPPPGPGTGSGGGHLPGTGASPPLTWLAGSAAVAMALGGAALYAARRRRG